MGALPAQQSVVMDTAANYADNFQNPRRISANLLTFDRFTKRAGSRAGHINQSPLRLECCWPVLIHDAEA